MSQAFKLWRLQQIDSQLDQANARLLEIERIMSDDARLNAAREITRVGEERVKKHQKALRQIENDVQDQRIKIEQTESALYGGKVRNPKELQDLQNESAALKRYVSVLEDRQLEAMLALEEAEGEHLEALKNLDEVSADLATLNASMSAEKAGLLKDVERLEQDRQATVSSISGEDLSLYEQLRQQRRGVAVARVSDRACSACGSMLTPAVIQTASTSGQLTRCSFCGRILYSG